MLNSKTKKFFWTLTFCVVFFGFSYTITNAVSEGTNVGLDYMAETGLGNQDIRDTIASIITIALGFLGALTVIIFLYAGFLYLTSGGDTEKIGVAKKLMINSVIGSTIVLSSYGIASFVLNQLSDATGLGDTTGSSYYNNGSSSSFPSSVEGFRVNSINPKGYIEIKNIIVRIIFNDNVKESSIAGNILIKDVNDNNSLVAGTFNLNGKVIEFEPATICVEDSTKNCFKGNNLYRVELKNGTQGILTSDHSENAVIDFSSPFENMENNSSALGQQDDTLICSTFTGENSCLGEFTTGDLVDVLGPTVNVFEPIDWQGIPQDSVNGIDVRFSIKDDAVNSGDKKGGVSYAKLYVKKGDKNSTKNYIEKGIFSHSFTPTPANIPDASILWNTEELELQSIHTLRVSGYDSDSNQKNSNEVSVIVRPIHCFNDILETDLGEIEAGPPACGGPCGQCSGDECSTNFDCPNGACLGGQCIDIPMITNIEPSDGAVGNFVTIYGRGFGAIQGTGKVVFLGEDGDSDDVDAIMPVAPCQNSWNNDYIVVEVPEQAKTGALKIVTADNLYDTTVDERGWYGEFTVNNVVRPGLCLVTPKEEEPYQKIVLAGKNFGTTPSQNSETFVKFGATVSQVGIWSDNTLSDVIVPNLVSGIASVTVTKEGIRSNSLDFKINNSKTSPIINLVDPPLGPKDQIITIMGSNFGKIPGVVEFLANNEFVANGSIDFIEECNDSYWHNTYIFIKVPNIPIVNSDGNSINYQIRIKTNESKISNAKDFDVNKSDISPGICKLSPDNGPNGIKVTKYGEGFGQEVGKIRYFEKEDVTLFTVANHSWNKNKIESVVPNDAITGPIVVINSDGVLSNRVNFSVGYCSVNSCEEGSFCCDDGSCREQCENAAPVCSYSWTFSTGNGGGDGNPLEPKVIEQKTCDETLQSPSPYKNKIKACTNSKIVARFNVDMNENTFKNRLTEEDSTILIQKCNTGAVFNSLQCNENLIGTLEVINQGQAGEGFAVTLGNINNPELMDDNTWYQIKIKGGTDGVRSNPTVNYPQGLPMKEDYIWKFNTATACTPDDVLLVPSKKSFDNIGEHQIFESDLITGDCSVLWGDDNKWIWQVSNNDGHYVSVTPFSSILQIFDPLANEYKIVERTFANKKTVYPLLETPKVEDVNTGEIIDVPVVLKSLYEILQDDSDILVDFSENDDNPEVIVSPSCDISLPSPSPFIDTENVCINSAVSARFTKDMNNSDLVNPNNIEIYRCKDGREECDVVIEIKSMEKTGNNEEGEGFVLEPNILAWLPNTWYEVVIKGGNSGMKSVIGKPLEEDFIWKFKTRDSEKPCNLSKVLVTPAIDIIKSKEGTTQYFGSPLADNCNILFGEYIWDWKIDPETDTRALLSPSEGFNKFVWGTEYVNDYDMSLDGIDNWLPENSENNAIFEKLSSPNYDSEKCLAIKKTEENNGGLYYDFDVLNTEGIYHLFVEYLVNNSKDFNIVVSDISDGNDVLMSVSSETTNDWEVFKQDFVLPSSSLGKLRIYITANGNQEIDACINTISVREKVSAVGSVIATAKEQTVPNDPVKIIGSIPKEGKSDESELVIIFDKPRVIDKWPECTSACRNAEIGGMFNIKMNRDILNNETISLYECSDEACSTLSKINSSVTTTDANVTEDGFGTSFIITPDSEDNLMKENTWYKIIVEGGNSGIKSEDGVLLSYLNNDLNDDGFFDSYAWKFKTNDKICVIDKVEVTPSYKKLFLIGIEQEYQSVAYSKPDICNSEGQKVDPFTLNWYWLSTFVNTATINNNDILPLDNIDSLIDPYQSALTTGPGETQINASDIISEVGNEATLKVICGYNDDIDCPDVSVNDYGVSSVNNCCYKRPQVIVPTNILDPVPNNVETSINTSFPQPAIGDVDVCRNALVSIAFNQPMYVDSFEGNVIVEVGCDSSETGFCKVEGEYKAVNFSNDLSVVTFVPNDLYIINGEYRVSIRGGVLDDNNVAGGVRSIYGISMIDDFVWNFVVGDNICSVDNVQIKVAKANDNFDELNFEKEDFFSCGVRNDCEEDILSEMTGSQHLYIPFAYDNQGELVNAEFYWTNINTDVLNICFDNPENPCVSYNNFADNFLPGTNIVSALMNGDSSVSVFARAFLDTENIASSAVDVEVFICNNPWPNIHEYPWKDTEINPTNFSFYYCRDFGDEYSLDDDLPKLKDPIIINPVIEEEQIETDPTCPSIADYVCGEDNKTYNNSCVANKRDIYIIHEGKCETKLIKEFLFFVCDENDTDPACEN